MYSNTEMLAGRHVGLPLGAFVPVFLQPLSFLHIFSSSPFPLFPVISCTKEKACPVLFLNVWTLTAWYVCSTSLRLSITDWQLNLQEKGGGANFTSLEPALHLLIYSNSQKCEQTSSDMWHFVFIENFPCEKKTNGYNLFMCHTL